MKLPFHGVFPRLGAGSGSDEVKLDGSITGLSSHVFSTGLFPWWHNMKLTGKSRWIGVIA